MTTLHQTILVVLSDAQLDQLAELVADKLAERMKGDPRPNVEEQYLTRDEVVKLFHISKQSLDKRAKEGTLRSHRVGRRVLFLKSELDEDIRKS